MDNLTHLQIGNYWLFDITDGNRVIRLILHQDKS